MLHVLFWSTCALVSNMCIWTSKFTTAQQEFKMRLVRIITNVINVVSFDKAAFHSCSSKG